jgi:hypothetical protein
MTEHWGKNRTLSAEVADMTIRYISLAQPPLSVLGRCCCFSPTQAGALEREDG